jgi:hypothetical protein
MPPAPAVEDATATEPVVVAAEDGVANWDCGERKLESDTDSGWLWDGAAAEEADDDDEGGGDGRADSSTSPCMPS